MSDLLPAVWAYHAAGFSVLPLRGKVPVVRWRTYQQRRPTAEEIRCWSDTGLFTNVGLVCGAVSGNLVALDFDTPRAYGVFQARFPTLASSRTVLTGGGGWHIYLRVASLPPSMRGAGIELRSTGQQVVAPPSIHPDTGRPYRVVRDVPIRRVESLAEVSGLNQHRHHCLLCNHQLEAYRL
ncbi:MAG: bifunctional DNA primase/polymerase [Anaerolineae bacterium]